MRIVIDMNHPDNILVVSEVRLRSIAEADKFIQAVRDAGEILWPSEPRSPSGSSAGGKARAAALSPERRSEIAKAAAAARWDEPIPDIGPNNEEEGA